MDHGHVLDAGRLRRAGDRHRQAGLARRLALPARGDRRGRRDGDRTCLRATRLGPRRAALRRAGLRERRWDRGAGAGLEGRDRARRVRRVRWDLLAVGARSRSRAHVGGCARVARRLSGWTARLELRAAGVALRHPGPRRPGGAAHRRERSAHRHEARRRGRQRPDDDRGRCDPRGSRHPDPPRRADERRRRHGVVLRVGPGSRAPLLDARRNSCASGGQARRCVRPRLGARGREGDLASASCTGRRHQRGRGCAQGPGIYP